MKYLNSLVLTLVSLLLATQLAHAAPAADLNLVGRASLVARTGNDLILGNQSTNSLKVIQNNVTTFSINGSTGAIAISGALTPASLVVTGAATVGTTLGVTGNFAVNTSKFTVDSTTGDTVIAGAASVTGAATITGDIVTTGTTSLVRTNSVDATDNKSLQLLSGSAASSSRGGYIDLTGNEVASIGGRVRVTAGNVSSGDIDLIGTNSSAAINLKTNSLQRFSITGSAGNISQDSTNGGGLILSRALNVADVGVMVGASSRVTDVAANALYVVSDASSVLQGAFEQATTDAVGTTVDFVKTRKTDNTADTIVASGDTIANLRFRGADGATFQNAAAIIAKVDGTPGTTDMPGSLDFQTTPDGSGTLASVLKLSNDKAALFTGTVRSSATADIGWSVVSGTNVACNTTCTSACVFGQETTSKAILACTDATADVCLCAGAS